MTFASTPAGGRVLAVTVTDHAIARARSRHHFERMPRPEIAGRIAHEVQQALAAGRCADRIPVWAARFKMRELRGAKPKTVGCRPGSVFVWDADERHGWIVKTDDDGSIAVVTSLHRVRGQLEDVA